MASSGANFVFEMPEAIHVCVYVETPVTRKNKFEKTFF
jgi:hypothetical protein